MHDSTLASQFEKLETEISWCPPWQERKEGAVSDDPLQDERPIILPSDDREWLTMTSVFQRSIATESGVLRCVGKVPRLLPTWGIGREGEARAA